MIRRIAAGVLGVLLSVSGYTVPARAQEGQSCSLHLTCQQEQEGIPDVRFQVYEVAKNTGGTALVLTEAFSSYPVDFTDRSESSWYELGITLAGYVQRDQPEPAGELRTGEDGSVTFSGLEAGLYLVIGDTFSWKGNTCRMTPFLAGLPKVREDGTVAYDAEAELKYERIPENTGTRRVLKLWDDKGYSHYRPESIEVQLLHNGEVYDTVTLNAGNNWQHQWSGLAEDGSWAVTESNVPARYTVTSVQDGNTFVVTNRYKKGGGGGGNGGGGSNPPGGSGTPPVYTEIQESDIPLAKLDLPEEPSVPLAVLPQTGMLWWPVPLLALGGLSSFLFGWIRRRKEEEGNGAG